MAQTGVTDGEHSSMQAVKASGPRTFVDGVRGQTGGFELSQGDHSVLPPRDTGNHRVRGAFSAHMTEKAPMGPVRPLRRIGRPVSPVSAQYSVTIRVELDARKEPLGKLTASIAEAGGQLQGVDLVPGAGGEGKRVREFTIDARDQEHWEQILRAIGSTRGAKVLDYVDRTLQMHRGGKIEQRNKYPLKTRDDLSMAYTPGVARVCQDIHADRAKAFQYTIKKNTVAVVSDGSAVLGLGNIGPEAAMPVMEGKAMLFKEFAGVDAFPICLDSQDSEEIVRAVELLAPTFGGINLEDIAAPRCFEIEERLKEALDIPVFHDDQHGTAVVVMAALFNALKIVGKQIEDLRVLVVGLGAAGVAVTKMMLESGVSHVVGCDRRGAISTDRPDYQDGEMSPIKRWYAECSNPDRLGGQPADVIEGMDLFIGLSGPGIVGAEDLAKMNGDAIVFAMANPNPEVMPEDAAPHVRIMATGRSDYPNQINNVLCFPGIFRGALDAGAPKITEEMKLAAATGIAEVVTDEDLSEDYIIPSVFNRDVAPAVAQAVVEEARREGIARLSEETGTFTAAEVSAGSAG
jgi:malate dehydrogenase (oxaloacetate-decarboxylating)